MSNKQTYEIENGDFIETMWEAKCPYCGKMVDCSWPSYEADDGTVICTQCAFVHGHITEQELRDIDYDMVVCINYEQPMGYTIDYWDSKSVVKE